MYYWQWARMYLPTGSYSIENPYLTGIRLRVEPFVYGVYTYHVKRF